MHLLCWNNEYNHTFFVKIKPEKGYKICLSVELKIYVKNKIFGLIKTLFSLETILKNK